MSSPVQTISRYTAIAIVLFISTDAWALRCGSRLIKDEMPEAEVIQLCGEPVSTEYLGYVLRPYILKRPAGLSGLSGTRHVYGGFHEELLAKELLFNFGPRKLMRRIRFEGGYLVSIETAGYGYHPEKK
jgi:hypothetical protein